MALPLLLNYRNRLALLLLFSVVSHITGICQNAYLSSDSVSVWVIDELGEHLSGVSVFNEDVSFADITTTKGKVVLPADISQIWTFTHIGYDRLVFSLEELKSINYRVQMLPVYKELDAFTVLGRMSFNVHKQAAQIQTIKSTQIARTNASTSAHALEQHSGVFVQRSQMGGGSPILRGFEANRVLLVVDGVRMNNAIYRSGHLQNAITVDVDALEALDIIYGPGSLLYGSDALGGVMHFRTIKPQFSIEKNTLLINGSGYVRFATANKEQSAHVNFNIGGSKLASFTSISYNNFGDLRTGKRRNPLFPEFGKRRYFANTLDDEDIIESNPNPNVLVGTGYNQLDMIQKFSWKIASDISLHLNLQLSTSSEIPRYDALTETNSGDPSDLRYARWDYGPQFRNLSAVKLDWKRSNVLFDEAVLLISRQQVQEQRLERRFGSPLLQDQLEKVDVWAFTADFQKLLSVRYGLRIMYGIDRQCNKVTSTASGTLLTNGEMQEVFTRYPSAGSNMNSNSMYIHLHAPVGNGFTIQAGSRFAFNRVNGRYNESGLFDWPAFFIDGFETDNQALTGALSVLKETDAGWTFRTQFSNAFRAPNIDDIAKTRVRRDDIVIPNLNLKPEYAYTFEMHVGKSTRLKESKGQLNYTYQFNLGGFYTILTNAVVQRPFALPSGDSTFVQNEVTYQVFANVNAEVGRIYGISFDQEVQLGRWHIRQNIVYTRGTALFDGINEQPMAHIPPLFGTFSLGYYRKKWSVSLDQRFNAAKPAEQFAPVSSDNLELATPIGSLPWWTFNLYGSYQVLPPLKIQLAIENMFDLHYRPFSSGVSAPGRNVTLTMRFQI